MSQGDQPRDLHDVSSDDPHPLVNPDSGSGDGGGTDARLRAIEMRLVKVETKLESFATKEDIQKLAATTQVDNQKLAATTREDIQKLAATTREDIQKLATTTKEDIQKLATTTKEDIQKLATTTKEDIQKLAATTQMDIQKLATQMAEMKSSMQRWFISTAIAIVLLVASLDRLLPW